MSNSTDRRVTSALSEADFTPEYLAVLVVCGGTVRAGDWALLPESLAARRPAANESTVVDEEDG